MFEAWLRQLNAGGIKPALTALLLPPVPLLVLVLLGAALLRRRPRAGWWCLAAGVAGLWLTATTAVGDAGARMDGPVARARVARPAAAQTRRRRRDRDRGAWWRAREPCSRVRWPQPEVADARAAALRAVAGARDRAAGGLYSGGVGHAQTEGPSEAEVAARVAQRDFGRALRFTESASRDTVGMARALSVQRVVLVTHGWHMPHSLRAFREAAAEAAVCAGAPGSATAT
jgi:hypothetical protein